MNWLKQNWDKVLFPVIGIVISGIAGFYAGIISINSSITALGERTAKIETELASAIKPKITSVDQHTLDLLAFKRDLDFLQKQTDLAVQTNKLLDLRIEQERQTTITHMRDFSRVILGKPSPR
jgi:uncharacterized membrane protein YccC